MINRNNLITRTPFDLINPFFDEFFDEESNSRNSNVMRTDIQENDDHYLFKIELPEVKKEEVKLSLENGYLTVEVEHSHEEKKEEKNSYIRRERFFGTYSRNYYVGDYVNEEDIEAKLEDGVLTLKLAKKEPGEEKRYIEIK